MHFTPNGASRQFGGPTTTMIRDATAPFMNLFLISAGKHKIAEEILTKYKQTNNESHLDVIAKSWGEKKSLPPPSCNTFSWWPSFIQHNCHISSVDHPKDHYALPFRISYAPDYFHYTFQTWHSHQVKWKGLSTRSFTQVTHA